jgi:hypothetical protein
MRLHLRQQRQRQQGKDGAKDGAVAHGLLLVKPSLETAQPRRHPVTTGDAGQTTTGSGSRRMPKRSYTLVWIARASVTTSPPVAPPRFTSTRACFS